MSDFYDFFHTMVRGRHLKLEFTVKDRAQADAPQDITNYPSFRLTGKDTAKDTDAEWVFTKTLSDGLTKTSPLVGVLGGTLVPLDTAGLAPGITHTIECELQCTDDDQESFSLERGIIEVLPDVSRTNP
jgi:hypothetical protein